MKMNRQLKANDFYLTYTNGMSYRNKDYVDFLYSLT